MSIVCMLFHLHGWASPGTTTAMKIVIGSDHAGFEYKRLVRDALREGGHDVSDFGTDDDRVVCHP